MPIGAKATSAGGFTAISSVMGSLTSDFFTLMGETGWLGTLVFYSFIFTIIGRLFGNPRGLLRPT